MSERVGLDSLPPVTEDEALELCVHHLQMAAIYFMNVSDDNEAVQAEARRIILRDNPTFTDDPRWVGARAFLQASWEAHEEARKRDSDEFRDCVGREERQYRERIDAMNADTCRYCGEVGGKHNPTCLAGARP